MMRKFINIVLENIEGEEMQEPRILYRGVSIPELVSVAFRGHVKGGGNTFAGDPRKWVFFGDELNSNLIAQGEDHSRYPAYALRDDPLHRDTKRAREAIEELGFLCASTLRFLAKKKQWNPSAQLLADLERGDDMTVRKVASDYGRYDAKFNQHLQDLKAEIAKTRDYHDSFMAAHSHASDRFRATREDWRVTSAVLVTQPIEGGMVFHGEHSYHDGSEYGFYPGDVTLDDLSEVILYHDGQEIERIEPDAILSALRALGVDTQPYME